jgi:hypothetical protein
MNLSSEDKNKLKIAFYDGLIEKCLKKKKVDILTNKYGFVRGIPKQLAEDIYSIRLEKIPENADKMMLERIKYICEYSLSKMPKSRKVKQEKVGQLVYDKFTQYQDALELVEKRLEEF